MHPSLQPSRSRMYASSGYSFLSKGASMSVWPHWLALRKKARMQSHQSRQQKVEWHNQTIIGKHASRLISAWLDKVEHAIDLGKKKVKTNEARKGSLCSGIHSNNNLDSKFVPIYRGEWIVANECMATKRRLAYASTSPTDIIFVRFSPWGKKGIDNKVIQDAWGM